MDTYYCGDWTCRFNCNAAEVEKLEASLPFDPQRTAAELRDGVDIDTRAALRVWFNVPAEIDRATIDLSKFVLTAEGEAPETPSSVTPVMLGQEGMDWYYAYDFAFPRMWRSKAHRFDVLPGAVRTKCGAPLDIPAFANFTTRDRIWEHALAIDHDVKPRTPVFGYDRDYTAAMAADGSSLAVWATATGALMYARRPVPHPRLDAEFGTPVAVSAALTRVAHNPRMVMADNGNAFLAWVEEDGATPHIRTATWNGSAWAVSAVDITGVDAIYFFELAAAYTGTGVRGVLAWTEQPNVGVGSLHAATILGGSVGTASTLGTSIYSFKSAANANGDAVLTWTGSTIKAVRLGPAASVLSAVENVENDNDSDANSVPGVAPNGEVLVIFERTATGKRTFGSRWTSAGGWGTAQLYDRGTSQGTSQSGVIFEQNGDVHVAITESIDPGPTGFDLYVTTYNAAGVAQTPVLTTPRGFECTGQTARSPSLITCRFINGGHSYVIVARRTGGAFEMPTSLYQLESGNSPAGNISTVTPLVDSSGRMELVWIEDDLVGNANVAGAYFR